MGGTDPRDEAFDDAAENPANDPAEQQDDDRADDQRDRFEEPVDQRLERIRDCLENDTIAEDAWSCHYYHRHHALADVQLMRDGSSS